MNTQPNPHPVKKYPIIGACGLDCGLCPSYHRDTRSRCPGCCGEGFWDAHPGCPFITCAIKQKGLETCGECNELEFCPKVLKLRDKAEREDSFVSYRTIPANLEFIRKNGIAKWAARQNEKIAFLKVLLSEFNDGRSKSFYCLSVQLLPLDKLKPALALAQKKMTTGMTAKEQAVLVREAFEGVAKAFGIELKLRGGK
jgi:hypothetical protein